MASNTNSDATNTNTNTNGDTEAVEVKPIADSDEPTTHEAIAVSTPDTVRVVKLEKHTDQLPALFPESVTLPPTTPLSDISPEILKEEIGTGPLPDLDIVLQSIADHHNTNSDQEISGQANTIHTETREPKKEGALEQPIPSAPIRFDPPKIESVPQRQDSLPPRFFSKPDPTRETAVLSDHNPILKRMIRQNSPSGTASLGEGREIILVIRGMVERILITEGKKYKLGRFEISSRTIEEIDLSPYGALDRGVSRVHAELTLKTEHIYVTDLTSTNGTYLAGTRLKPNEPTLLRKGDELLIGRLPVQVLFR